MSFRTSCGQLAVLSTAVCSIAPSVFSQEKLMSLDGRVFTGFYSTSTRNGAARRISFVPFGGDLDFSSYILDPALVSFQLKPQFTAGPQASEAGLLAGNGIAGTATFLGQRSFPLRLRFKDTRREDVFFGGLNQFSGFRSQNREREFAVNWELHAAGLPQVTLDWGRNSLSSDPDLSLIPDYRSRSRYRTIGIRDQRWGWDMEGIFRKDALRSNLITTVEPGQTTTYDLEQYTEQNQGTARRNLSPGSQVSFSGGTLNLKTSFLSQPFVQDVRFGNGSYSFGQGRRFQGSLRAGYSSNLLSSQIQKAITGLAGAGPGTLGPDALVAEALDSRVSNLNTSGAARWEFSSDWNLFGSVNENRGRFSTSTAQNRASDYITGVGGVAFQHQFARVNLTSQYSRTEGSIHYNGVRGKIHGDSYSATAQHGDTSGIQIGASFHGSNQQVNTIDRLENSTYAGEGSAAHTFQRLRLVVRGGAGFERSQFHSSSYDYSAQGLRFNAGLDHRMAQASYSRSRSDGNSLQAFLTGIAANPATGPLLLGAPLRLLLSQHRADTLMIHANPWRRLEGSVMWTHGEQHFDRKPTNDFEQLEASAGYRFRLVTFEAGYSKYSQSLFGLPPYVRSRLFFRLVREFSVL